MLLLFRFMPSAGQEALPYTRYARVATPSRMLRNALLAVSRLSGPGLPDSRYPQAPLQLIWAIQQRG